MKSTLPIESSGWQGRRHFIMILTVLSLFTLSFRSFLPLSQTWLYAFFFLSSGTRKGTDMLNGPANLRKFHRRKRDKSCSKVPYFLCRKALRNGLELRQDLYLSMRKLSTLVAPKARKNYFSPQ